MGKLLIIAGIVLLAAGLAALYAPWLFSWFGRLPGDIHIVKDRFSFFFPVVSMIILSVVFTILANLFLR